MAIKSSREIYRVLEEAIRASATPVTCVDLLEVAAIRKVAIADYGKDMRITTDKVSDALGLMWRRGYLKRFPAPQTSKTLARFAYLWDDKNSKPAAPVSFPSGKTGVAIHKVRILIELETSDGSVRFERERTFP